MNAPLTPFRRKPAAPAGWNHNIRLELRPTTAAETALEEFGVPVTQVRRAIADHYARGIYRTDEIASRLGGTMRRSGSHPVRVDAEMIREIRRRERSAIESDVATLLSQRASQATLNPTLSRSVMRPRLSAASCLREARERMRLALWLDLAKR